MPHQVNHPSISVIIPAYNAERYLGEAIESILKQTLPVSEIIVVDDGSTDGTASVARSYDSVIYLSHKQSGSGAARNLGVQRASGEWLSFLDADDLWHPEKLRRQFEAFRGDSPPSLVFSQIVEFTSADLSSEAASQLQPRTEPMPGLLCSSMVISRTDFLATGGFPTELKLGEFIAWYDIATNMGLKPFIIPEVLVFRRLHETNQGRQNRGHLSQFALIAKWALERKRGNANPPS